MRLREGKKEDENQYLAKEKKKVNKRNSIT